MNLFEAKQLLKKCGYRLIKEETDIGLTNHTPADILSKLFTGIYHHWADADLSYSDIESAFRAGWEGKTDWQEFRSYYDEDYDGKDLDYLNIVFNDGRKFGTCKNDSEIKLMLDDKFDV